MYSGFFEDVSMLIVSFSVILFVISFVVSLNKSDDGFKFFDIIPLIVYVPFLFCFGQLWINDNFALCLVIFSMISVASVSYVLYAVRKEKAFLFENDWRMSSFLLTGRNIFYAIFVISNLVMAVLLINQEWKNSSGEQSVFVTNAYLGAEVILFNFLREFKNAMLIRNYLKKRRKSIDSTQTDQSYAKNQQMVSSSWNVLSERSSNRSEYGKERKNYTEENVEFIADFLKKNMTTQLRDINPTVSISEKQTLKEIYFDTYLPSKDKYERIEMEKTSKGKELIQNFVKIEKNVIVSTLRLNNQILNSVDENSSIRALAELIEPHLSFSSFLENDKGKELFEIIDEMFNLINDEHFATINSSKQYIQINQNNSNASSVKKALEYTLAVDLNLVGLNFASNPEMERLWTGVRQYIFVSHYHLWINYGEFYDISVYNWKNLFESCIKKEIDTDLCEYIYNEKKYTSSFEEGQDPINLFFARISGLLILAGVAAEKHSKLVSDLALLRSRFIKKMAEFDGKVTSDEEEQVDDLISNMDEVFDLDLSGKKAKAEEEMKRALELDYAGV